MNIRVRGMLQFIGAGLGFGTWLWWFAGSQGTAPGSGSSPPGGYIMVFVMAALGGFAIAGLLQLITGMPFSKMSDQWNALEGWQRGVYGTLVFVGGLALLFGGLIVYGVLTAN